MPEINATIIETKDELWPIYACWACVLVLKMMLLIWFTGQIRKARQVIHSDEDRMWMKNPKIPITITPTAGGHPDVDRIRSAHRHDLETVLPFLLLFPIYLSTSPEFFTARLIMAVFSLISITHTLLHMEILKAPAFCRSITALATFCITTYTCVMSTMHYANA